MRASTFLRPGSLEGVFEAMAGGALVMAGGTDVYPTVVGRDVPADVVDITGVAELAGLGQVDEGGRRWWRIGATATWAEVARATMGPGYRALQEAARQVGAVQVQQVATVAGNLCTASPAGDGIPVLMALDGEVELRSAQASRRCPVAQFVTGYRATALAPGELVTAVWLPEPDGDRRSAFVKFATRSSLVISLAMVAAAVVRDPAGAVTSVSVAVGACSPVAVRLNALERDVVAGWDGRVTAVHLGGLSPIDDIRCSAAYRMRVLPELIRRALHGCGVAPGVAPGWAPGWAPG